MYLIGIDSSTTATKSLIIDADGKIVAVAAAEYPFETPHPLWSEQHPDLWWDGTVQSMRALALDQSGIDPAQVAAVGVSGQMHHWVGAVGRRRRTPAAGHPLERSAHRQTVR